MRKTTQDFNKGINERYNIQKGGADRLFKLQNARINERGNTFSVSRIKGAEGTSIFPAGNHTILDMIYGLDNNLFIYWTEDTGETQIKIVDIANINLPVVIKDFSLGIQNIEYGELDRQGTIVYMSPLNKMINYINGQYYMNNTIAEYPEIITAGVLSS